MATSLPDLIKEVAALTQRVVALEGQVAATAAEQSSRTTRISDLEAYAQNNSARIDAMEVRYDAVVDEINVIAGSLTKAIADLEATDEASGWKKWKEQRKAEQKASQ
jgi:hypothetical protein